MSSPVRKLQNASIDSRELACSKCGRYEFPDVASAYYHENICDGKAQNTKGPWKCKGCGKADFTRSQAFGSHRSSCTGAAESSDTPSARRVNYNLMNSTSIGSLKPVSLGSFRIQLSDYNYLVTDWVDLFQTGEADVQGISVKTRKQVMAGDIGMRCLACRDANLYSVGSVMYPGCLEHIPHTLYNMVGRHMLEYCPNMPASTKKQLATFKITTTRQSMCIDRIGLPVYLKMVFKGLHLQNRPNGQRGIEIASNGAAAHEDVWQLPPNTKKLPKLPSQRKKAISEARTSATRTAKKTRRKHDSDAHSDVERIHPDNVEADDTGWNEGDELRSSAKQSSRRRKARTSAMESPVHAAKKGRSSLKRVADTLVDVESSCMEIAMDRAESTSNGQKPRPERSSLPEQAGNSDHLTTESTADVRNIDANFDARTLEAGYDVSIGKEKLPQPTGQSAPHGCAMTSVDGSEFDDELRQFKAGSDEAEVIDRGQSQLSVLLNSTPPEDPDYSLQIAIEMPAWAAAADINAGRSYVQAADGDAAVARPFAKQFDQLHMVYTKEQASAAPRLQKIDSDYPYGEVVYPEIVMDTAGTWHLNSTFDRHANERKIVAKDDKMDNSFRVSSYSEAVSEIVPVARLSGSRLDRIGLANEEQIVTHGNNPLSLMHHATNNAGRAYRSSDMVIETADV